MLTQKTTSSSQDAAMLLGRILMSVIFVLGGWGKLMAADSTISGFAHYGLPFPGIGFVLAVVIELVGGLLLLLGAMTSRVAVVIGIWCIATALVAHTNFADRNMMIHFMKNLAMAGGCAYIAAFGAGAYSIDALRLRRRTPIAA